MLCWEFTGDSRALYVLCSNLQWLWLKVKLAGVGCSLGCLQSNGGLIEGDAFFVAILR